MKYANSKMKRLIVETPSQLVLPQKLLNILDSGLDFIEDGVFFKSICHDLKLPNITSIKASFGDMSGYENSTNRLHIEDYCERQLFEVSFLFMDKFLDIWRKSNSSHQCVAALNFQLNTDYGNLSSFTFHKYRNGEIIYQLENLDKFEDPVLIALS